MKKKTKGRVREFQSTAQAEPRQERTSRERKEKPTRKRKKIRVNKLRIVLTVMVIVLIAVVGMSVKTVFDLRAEQKELRQTNAELRAQKEALDDELKNVNDIDYIEEQARIQLRLIKPGEIMYIVDDEDEDNGEEDN